VLDLDSYLKRIGYSGPRTATLETLRALQTQHPLAIPFENLDTLSGRPLALDLPSLERKLVQSRRLTPTAPIEFALDVEQPTPHETFRVVRGSSEHALEANVRGAWKRLYRFDLQEQHQIDIEVLNHYIMTHAESPMRTRLFAARATADRRYGLGNGVLSVHHLHGASEQQRIGDVGELKRVLEQTFGIEAPAGKDVDAALARVLA